MDVKVAIADPLNIPCDALIVHHREGEEEIKGAAKVIDAALEGGISQLIASGEIKGKLNEISLLHTFGRIAARRVLVVGLGPRKDFTLDKLRGASASACKALRRVRAKEIATVMPEEFDPSSAAQAVAEGAILGLYDYARHKSKEPEYPPVDRLLILEPETDKGAAGEQGSRLGKILAEATNLARDLVNEPANFMTPSRLAEVAQGVSQTWGLEFTSLEPEDMRALGMGAILGVAQGSKQPPRLIVLEYKGATSDHPSLGLIGKGITFDSGGISLKAAEKMDLMKGDMAGGAAVIAALQAVGQIKPRINVIGIVPATENLPGGAALKPGDILKAMNGKTIEVINTDGEGRLILADALSYARQRGLSYLVDVATLTGACAVALGSAITGAFGNNQRLIEDIVKAGEEAGEKIWPMPLEEEYRELIKSPWADIKNSAGREGGAITAALFLSEFVEDTPWVHLDIAGTFYQEKDSTYRPKGASGVAVRTLVNLAVSLAEKQVLP